MGIINAMDLKKGATTKKSAFTALLYQPLQMLPESEKDDSWRSSNMDFLEWQGVKQILRNKRKFISNYKIANAEIEKRDYIREEMEQEFVQLADRLKVEELAAMELKYYSLTDKVVDILCNEFAERVSLLTFDLRDPISFNELMDKKKADMEQYLLQQASLKQQQKMMQMGISADSEEGKQMMDPQALKNMPQIQKFYEQDFKTTYQDWAHHCMNEDVSRFNMQELEVLNFRHSLIVDREFWHFRMMENDYNVEIWNPMLVAYQKSPQCKYISGASWVIHSTEMTVPDVIDMYGWQMSEDQILNMNRVYPLGGSLYSLNGLDNGSGQFYDSTQSKEWNTEGPGIAMRQHLSAIAASGRTTLGSNPVRDILLEGEDLVDYGDINLVRVSTIYWTTQRKMYHLTKINGEGELIQDIVGENYKVTDKPMYNTVLYKEKTANNLVFGEHLEALWINEKWGGIKIGPNVPSWAGMTVTTGLQPMYIGYDNGKPGRLPFQFKGDKSLYDSKLPVEGCIFTDLTGNTRSRSLVDKMKPWQIPYNMVNNMIIDVTIDELGVVMAFNPNILPQHSMGEDWGKANLQKGMDSIRRGVLPTNRTLENMEGIPDNAPIERIDLTQANRFTSLIQRAQYFKLGALEAVGLNPTRMGTPISQEQTATEIKQAVAAASSSTEHYFSQHSDFLMPRVHQMRTDLAQYYNSTNPSIRIQYTTDSNARAWMTLNGTELMGKDFGVKCKTKTNTRAVLQQIKQFLMNNNTLADNLADHVKAMKADNMVEMDTLMSDIERRLQQQEQQRMEQEQQQHQEALDMQMKLIQEKQQWEAEQADLERQKDIYVAELQAAARAATAKTPDQGEAAYQEGLDRVEQQNQFRETMNLQQQKHLTDTLLKNKTLAIREQEIAAENARTNQQAQAKRIEAKAKVKSTSKK